jgi:hypothetical protein
LIKPQIVQLINLLQTRLVFGQHLERLYDARCGVGVWRNDAGDGREELWERDGGERRWREVVVESDGREKRACSPVAIRDKVVASGRAAQQISTFSAARIGNSVRSGESSCSIATIESRIALSCPPMTLREREVLNAIQVGFLIPPLLSIFHASATQVLTKTVCPSKPYKPLYKSSLTGFQAVESLYKSPIVNDPSRQLLDRNSEHGLLGPRRQRRRLF